MSDFDLSEYRPTINIETGEEYFFRKVDFNTFKVISKKSAEEKKNDKVTFARKRFYKTFKTSAGKNRVKSKFF